MQTKLNFDVRFGIIALVLIIIGAVYLNGSNLGNADPGPTLNLSGPSKYDDFAKCLTEKGAKMYGAFWCGHCQNQKEAFGASFQYVNYIECTENGVRGSFSETCKNAGIKGYPTWKFSDGGVKEGEVPMIELAKITGCELPN